MPKSIRLIYAVTVIGLVVLPAPAQLPVPRLNSIYPCGGRQGSVVECTVKGAELDGASGLYFSHAGLAAEPLGPDKFRVTIAKDVPVGQYDVRVVAAQGISNFRAFVVGDWPEALEKEPNNEFGQAQRVTLPTLINGRVDNPTDVDHYLFSARKGQRLLINCWAWRIDSQLDATLMLYDSKGKELAYSGDYYGKDPFLDFTVPEDGEYVIKIWDFVYGGGSDYFYRLQIGSLPHLDAIIPAAVRAGEQTTVAIYGRNLPGGKPAPDGAKVLGCPLEVITREIRGPMDAVQAVSLHGGEAVRAPQAGLDGMDFRLTTPEGSSNPLFLAFTNDPVLTEKEPNNERSSAQKVPVPCDITGSFAQPGDMDFYAFSAKKNEKLVIEVVGERQSGLVDPYLVGFDKAGKRLVSADDSGRNIGQLRFTTNTRDPRWDFSAPADGEYYVQVRDLYYQQRGDARLTYRLSIRRPQPDFRLVAVPTHDTQPDATVVRRGGRYWLDVLAYRNDGFDDPITIEASNLPAGVTCEPVVIGPGKTSAPLVFHAAPDAPLGHAALQIVGRARIDVKQTTRYARGGGLTWQTVNTPGIARLADSIVLAVREAPPFTITAIPAKTKLAAGEKLALAVKIDRASDWNEAIQLSGFDLPQNATVALANVAKGAGEAKVEVALPAKLKPGTYSFTINGAGQVPRDYARERDPKKARGNNVRVVYPSNPITITVGPGATSNK